MPISEVTPELGYEDLLEYLNEGNPTRDERLVIADYSMAFNENNLDRLRQYAALGSTIRHRVMNMNEYNHNILFGFSHTNFGKYEWLERVEFGVEIINLNPKADDKAENCIKLGKGANGKYAYGYSFAYGNGGCGSSPSVFGEPINTRDEAFDIAINFAKNEFTKYKNSNDRGYNQPLIKQVLDGIDEIQNGKKQLALF